MALAVRGQIVFAGGFFDTIAGYAHRNLVALDTQGYSFTWNLDTSGGYVTALAVSGSTLYVGGYFTKLGGQLRNGIAAIDASTGAVNP
ncbi:MAG: hypothetical protein ACT4PE_06265 [Candidatus Eiseniibacteriota bacterium]